MVSIGIEEFCKHPPSFLKGKRLGLLCNQASTDRFYRHSRELINNTFPHQLTCLFSPQHGFFAEKQDNMKESNHDVDPVTGIKIFSLYGQLRKPDKEMFDHLDTLLVDLVDVGTRVYTFLYTVAYCLEAAKEFDKEVVILDRPNPLGGQIIEGNLLKSEWRSFVGLYPIPMRHGLTLGELALFINEHLGNDSIGARLRVIAMHGWKRDMYFRDTGLPWIFPSPNMPTPETALVYPGQVLFEGTNISEGRGTSLPFEIFGAPFINPNELLSLIGEVPGCILRPLLFEPTSNKWAGHRCYGFQIHINNRNLYRPYSTSLILLQAIMLNYPIEFKYKTPPYEYEHDHLPLDLIIGDRKIRKALEQKISISDLEKSWLPALQNFDNARRKVFLYS